MKKSIIFLAFFGIAIVFAQKFTTLAEYKASIKSNKSEAKKAIKPYLYDGYKTTYFNYKTFKQTKEVEIYLFNNTEYKLAFNTKSCSKGIKINIYNTEKSASNRILLKTIENSSENLVVSTKELNEVLEVKKSKATRLKRVFVSYEIPSNSSANNTKPLIEDRAAIVLVMGYKN